MYIGLYIYVYVSTNIRCVPEMYMIYINHRCLLRYKEGKRYRATAVERAANIHSTPI